MTLPILGTSAVNKDQMKQLLTQRNPSPPLEVIDLYYELEPQWGIRADVLVCQMFHETDFLKSWWSQPPRRNMAGIGVTGAHQAANPNSVAWAFKPEDNQWYAGYAFVDWRAAVQAHYGHMSAYCFADERNNASQLDPRYSAARGAFASKGWPRAQVMTDLNGKWAVPGDNYGQSIESVLNTAKAIQVSSEAPAKVSAMSVSAPASNPAPVGAPNIIDLTSRTPDSVYTGSRAPYDVKVLVLHDTVGSDNAPDRNDIQLDFQGRENSTIGWFQGGGGISVHYLVGPESLGAKIYLLCPENGVAYHAGGSANFPSSWTAPDGTLYKGRYNDVGIMNYISIGIERWGAVNENVGPNQTRAMLALCVDIARRYNLTPQQIVPHKDLEGDREDGGVLLDKIRAAVAQQNIPAAAPVQAMNAPAPAAPQTPTPTPIQILPPLDIPVQSEPTATPPVDTPAQPEPTATQPTSELFQPSTIQILPAVDVPSASEAPTPGGFNPTWAQGVDGVAAWLGAGTVINDGTLVRDRPQLTANTIRSLNQGTALRFSAYTDSGADAGLGARWYLIDDADGGGWVYFGSVNV